MAGPGIQMTGFPSKWVAPIDSEHDQLASHAGKLLAVFWRLAGIET